jgi:GNAT superfamily N-acetyltransferase
MSSLAEEMKVTTRLAEPSDVDRMDILLRSFREEYGYVPHIATPLPDPERGPLYVILAEYGGKAVGMLAAQRCYGLAHGVSFLLLSDIYVLEAHRQRGVAKELMRAVKELCAKVQCQGMSLIVQDFNIAALTTAARSGFSQHNSLLLSYTEEAE